MGKESEEMERLLTVTGKMNIAISKRLSEMTLKGRLGWDTLSMEELQSGLKRTAEEGRWVDHAIYSMFIWHRDWTGHLDRDFSKVGNEPEHACCTGA